MKIKMTSLVSIVNSPSKGRTKQQIYITTRSELAPCWKNIATTVLKQPMFRLPGDGQDSCPRSVSISIGGQPFIYVVEAVVSLETGFVSLQSVLMQQLHTQDGCPAVPNVIILKPFEITNVATPNRTHDLFVAHDSLSKRVFVLFSVHESVRLFCHHYDNKNDIEWFEMALPQNFNPSDLSSTGLLFSKNRISQRNSPTILREMLDLTECQRHSHDHFGPYYIISLDNESVPLKIEVVDSKGMPLGNGEKRMTFNPELNLYFTDSHAANSRLLTGIAYEFDLPNGFAIEGRTADDKPHRLTSSTHTVAGGGVISKVTLTPYLNTDRIKFGKVHQLSSTNTIGSITGIKRNNGDYILIDRTDVGVHGENHVYLLEKNSGVLAVMEGDGFRLFERSGPVDEIFEMDGGIYIRTKTVLGKVNDLHKLWHLQRKNTDLLLTSGNVMTEICFLKTLHDTKVFVERHIENIFNVKKALTLCLCAAVDDGRLFTCTCAGDSTELNRLADIYARDKAFFKPNWDLLYCNGKPEPVLDDGRAKACMVY